MLVPFLLCIVHPSPSLGEGKAACDYGAQEKIVKVPWASQQGRKRGTAHPLCPSAPD